MYGRILRQLRESKGRSQTNVAQSVGISPARPEFPPPVESIIGKLVLLTEDVSAAIQPQKQSGEFRRKSQPVRQRKGRS